MKIRKLLKNVPENNIPPSPFAAIGKIVYCLYFKVVIIFIFEVVFQNYQLSSPGVEFCQKTVGSNRGSLANYYIPLTPCKGLDLRYSVIFGRIINEKILQSQFIYYVINFGAVGVSFPDAILWLCVPYQQPAKGTNQFLAKF